MRNVFFYVPLFIVLLQFSCTTPSNKEKVSSNDAEAQKEAERLVSRAVSRFDFSTFSSQIAIKKVYSEKVKFDDEMRILTKTDNNHKKFLIQIKPGDKHSGKGMLIEQEGSNKITSAYTFVPGKEEPVPIDSTKMKVGDSNLVIGGLSFLDIQILQGVRPFEQVRNEGVATINSKSCYQLAIKFAEGQNYDHAQFFISQEELPVLIKVFDRNGAAIKEISFEKFESISDRVFVKELIVRDQVFNYSSTLEFKHTRINGPMDEKVFTLDYLKKGWRGES
jgi:hypothetical protein